MGNFSVNESYAECLVRRKTRSFDRFLYAASIAGGVLMAIIFLYLSVMTQYAIVFFIIAVGLFVLSHFLKRRLIFEYEYTYIDKEIAVDRVLGMIKRKRIATFSFENIELFAPVNSTKALQFSDKEWEPLDLSVNDPLTANQRYALYTTYKSKKTKVLLQTDKAFAKAAYTGAPRKVVVE